MSLDLAALLSVDATVLHLAQVHSFGNDVFDAAVLCQWPLCI